MYYLISGAIAFQFPLYSDSVMSAIAKYHIQDSVVRLLCFQNSFTR
ncbi:MULTISPECIES: hypothetical protein [unclassified Nostoc]|nr:hypothetical protein [Nostoc sp. ChiQUE02]